MNKTRSGNHVSALPFLYAFFLVACWPASGQSRFAVEISGAPGVMVWKKTIEDKYASYDPFSNKVSEYTFRATYREPSFTYNLNCRIQYAIGKTKLGLSFTHQRFSTSRLKSEPFQWSWLSYYEPVNKFFNLYGINITWVHFENGKLTASPTIEVGMHWFEAKGTSYFRNNGFIKAGVMLTRTKSRFPLFIRPEITFVNANLSTGIFTDPEKLSIQGSWERWSSVHRNRIYAINFYFGIRLGQRNQLSTEMISSSVTRTVLDFSNRKL